MVLIGKFHHPHFKMATLSMRSLSGSSHDGRQKAHEDHNWAWPPILGALGSCCPIPDGLEELGGPTGLQLTQAP